MEAAINLLVTMDTTLHAHFRILSITFEPCLFQNRLKYDISNQY